MAFNIFKKKGRAVQKKEEKPKEAVLKQAAPVSDHDGLLSHVLQRPHISEKAGILAERNEYAFVISPRANKRQIKAAVEDRYKVKVAKVWTSRIPSKKRKVGKRVGIKQGFRKAIVKLTEGHTIEVLPR
ncbi:MAG: 50S ribosomal protein L23 [Parcubacteria group bacterium]|nr:50S ribosomal protein L23 [Parcubacteria group bacterium]